jgi:mannose-1-phosphate guanylyltransferase
MPRLSLGGSVLLIAYSGDKFSPFSGFWEKPSVDKSVGLRSKGCIWNTFVLVGETYTFLNHIQKHMFGVFIPPSSIERILVLSERRKQLRLII